MFKPSLKERFPRSLFILLLLGAIAGGLEGCAGYSYSVGVSYGYSYRYQYPYYPYGYSYGFGYTPWPYGYYRPHWGFRRTPHHFHRH